MDLLGPLLKRAHGNRHVLVMTDRFTKLAHSIPLRTTTASVMSNAFPDNWVYVYGAPRYVLTGNGPQFAAKFFEEVCAQRGVRHYLTTTYQPQTNGQPNGSTLLRYSASNITSRSIRGTGMSISSP